MKGGKNLEIKKRNVLTSEKFNAFLLCKRKGKKGEGGGIQFFLLTEFADICRMGDACGMCLEFVFGYQI